MNLIYKTLFVSVVITAAALSLTAIDPSGSNSALAEVVDCGCESETSPCETCEEIECGAAVECDACPDDTCREKDRGCKCKRDRRLRKKVSCPSCAVECDTCTLKLDHYKEEKTCFKTEQKIVCIPPVRFPWEKCCPPGRTSKTRTVNVLKVHKYECDACGYKWELDPLPEPVNPTDSPDPTSPESEVSVDAEPAAAQQSNVDPVVAPVEGQNLLTPTEAPQPEFEPATEAPVPDFDDVPPAPAG